MGVAAAVVIGAAVGVPLVLSGHAVRFLEYMGALMVLGTGQAIAVDRAARRTHPRPRWHYLLFSLGFVIAAAGCGLTAGWAARHHNGLSTVLAGAAIAAGAGALVAAARGSFRGRLRRGMWRYPPPWLEIAEAEEAGSRDQIAP